MTTIFYGNIFMIPKSNTYSSYRNNVSGEEVSKGFKELQENIEDSKCFVMIIWDEGNLENHGLTFDFF